ncbi:xanthine dehydrogenase family protein molybdopterin-binding subunit [Halalkalicoccus jeotgali]|uniref:Aldehyde oxidase and xanthine dehydrogenase molybdopterin binding protein n=1 Tax=Halalkalicoccus jeotgali (strain DSM 18796 / CECT 7217 / JCM 14584 / KCTC 4019 / B3) TaxID=795797 RepID=D8JCG7_HALJB|nr:xanthine dehydrogenase family protein molybdopterin-binding subunit [Halalkalicoccus jeotgali]ADJ17074.1 aldehyde oxidase and xanthine dehydrogenase molybdopterin binding protein [Halalkalicoccus jeotgali B3]ELY41558.1 aldehyde oxidase and xanthine dehydrogenase molybdopterin binding protein [Halalkalicoccus jeotgali B3]
MTFETIDARNIPPSELIGSAIQRREDPHLLTGESEYTDDIQYDGEVHLGLLGSRYGHARIESITTTDAAMMDGVLGVYTWKDIQKSDAPGYMRVDNPTEGSAESDTDTGAVAPEHPLLADTKVTYQGQPVAAVVAEDRYTVRDALESIAVDYERLDAIIDPRDALSEDVPQIHETNGENLAFEWETGDEDAAEATLATADNVVTVDFEINRVIPTAMEPRTAVAQYHSSDDELAVELSTQNPHQVRADLSATLGTPEKQIRVRPPDVGGGFGAKLFPYTGHLLAGWCARRLERPVKWVAPRTEDFQSMIHSRHHIVHAQAAVDDDGTIRGFQADTTVPVGGFLVPNGSGVPTNLGVMANGQYDIPAAYVQTRGAFTNTAPLSAYRGAGRPEATYFIERLVETVARKIDVDPADLRRKNFIPPEAFPFETGLGRTYDSGEYDETLTTALGTVDYETFRERQQRDREEGRYRGIGLSCYVEACGAAPGLHESGAVHVEPSGRVVVKTGTAEIGTGHRTGYTQIVADELGVLFNDVEIIEGDTAEIAEGNGTAGSRAMPVGGSALKQSAEEIVEKGREIVANQLEASKADIEFADGEFFISGIPTRTLTIQEVAEIAHDESGTLPDGMDPGLAATTDFDPPNYTFPFGTHVAVVEVDPDSGEIDLERYVAVDDVGTQINPKIIEGQIHGGVAQGIGQALYEEAIYDDNGNLLTGSMQDYAIPKAEHLPDIEWYSTVTPSPYNPLGVKGVGEAGAIAAPPAIVNAVIDAIEPFDVDTIDMPLTPETIWTAIQRECE